MPSWNLHDAKRYVKKVAFIATGSVFPHDYFSCQLLTTDEASRVSPQLTGRGSDLSMRRGTLR